MHRTHWTVLARGIKRQKKYPYEGREEELTWYHEDVTYRVNQHRANCSSGLLSISRLQVQTSKAEEDVK